MTSLPRRRWRAVQLDGSRSGGTSAISCVGGVDPELRLRRTGRRAAAQPGQLLAHQVLPRASPPRPPLALVPRQHVGGVPALVSSMMPPWTSQVALHDLVEEPPVVADDDQAPTLRAVA